MDAAVVDEFPANGLFRLSVGGLFGLLGGQNLIEGEDAIEEARDGLHTLVHQAVAKQEGIGEGGRMFHERLPQLGVFCQ